MLSGIGPKASLEEFDIPVLADLPGVGQNLIVRLPVPRRTTADHCRTIFSCSRAMN